jgi:hypothetical protein
MDKSDEIRLQVMIERMVKAHALSILKRWNNEATLKEWPANQEWDDLVGSSQTTLLRHACEELDVNFEAYKKIYNANRLHKAVSQID